MSEPKCMNEASCTSTLETLRLKHPGLAAVGRGQCLRFIASFLHRVFVASNARAIPAELVLRLEDHLHALREQRGEVLVLSEGMD